MPTATQELRAVFTEEKAWWQLAGKVTESKGIIKFNDNYMPTEKDWDAIDYLCQEWDYEYEPMLNIDKG